MYKETRKGTELTILSIGMGLKDGTLSSVGSRVAAVLDATPFLNRVSRKDIMDCAMDLARRGKPLAKKPKLLCDFLANNLEGIMKAWNRSYRRAWVRIAKQNVVSGLKFHRFQEDPIVFYMVSWHQKPQPAHKDLQGRILIDREWRTVLVDAVDGSLTKDVGSYVRKNKTITVQDAMGAPHYLCTRPNCKHYLIPMPTRLVLNNGVAELKAKVKQRNQKVHRPITDHDRWVAYKDLCASVRTKLRKAYGLDRGWRMGI